MKTLKNARNNNGPVVCTVRSYQQQEGVMATGIDTKIKGIRKMATVCADITICDWSVCAESRFCGLLIDKKDNYKKSFRDAHT